MNFKALLLAAIFITISSLKIEAAYGKPINQKGTNDFSLSTNCGWFGESRPCQVFIANGKLYLIMNGETNEVRKVWAGTWINPASNVPEEVAHSELSHPGGGLSATTIRFYGVDDRAKFWEAL